MAQILVSFIESQSGSNTASFALKDSDINRIINAYRHQNAVSWLDAKQKNGEILEASDTVDNISKQFAVQDILEQISERFVEDLCKYAYQVESNIAYQKIYASIQKIEIEN